MNGEILNPLFGGVLIAVASSIMLGGIGRIMGISGIVSGVLSIPKKDEFWRYSFFVGMLTGGYIMYNFSPQFFEYSLSADPFKLIVAGLLVGFGTRLGSGCTSGHGVCGLPRLARRSIIATITFMVAGIITVLLERLMS